MNTATPLGARGRSVIGGGKCGLTDGAPRHTGAVRCAKRAVMGREHHLPARPVVPRDLARQGKKERQRVLSNVRPTMNAY